MTDSTNFYIQRRNSSFNALIAKKIFAEGSTLIDLSDAKIVSAPDYMSIDLGDKHVYHPIGRYINHSCEPNAYIEAQQQKLIALKAIDINDEITFNYLISERKITAPFDCSCRSDKCVKRVEK